MGIESILNWTFYSECPLPNDVKNMLIDGEEAVEIYCLPYSSVNMWSTENAGSFLDFNAEVELWTRAGHIKINLNKKIDIRKFDALLANVLLK